jgi:hypothetical protein
VTLLEAIESLQRLQPTEWGPFRALQTLATARSWEWRDSVHKNLFLKLVIQARLTISPNGIISLLEEVETLIPAYPKNQGELEQYLRVILAHKLIEPQARKKYSDLIRLTVSDKWEWSHQVHRLLFQELTQETGAVHTKKGVIDLDTHQILSYEGFGECKNSITEPGENSRRLGAHEGGGI